MEITALIHTHGKPEVTWDTVDSVRHHMTNQILVLVDEAGWHHFDPKAAPVNMLKGFYHGHYKASYRNVALGMLAMAQHWPDSDWYAYLEYDCLVGSSAFKQDLQIAADQGVWIIGNDYREQEQRKVKFPLIEKMLGKKIEEIVYLLGAVMFFNKKFIQKAMQENWFERFLYYTNDFRDGFFPGYHGPAAWDLTEHLLPTLAKHWGGKVSQFAKWKAEANMWLGGNYRRYPIRWQPELQLVEQEYLQASIMHPLKSYDHPIREFYRAKRMRKKMEEHATVPIIKPV
jgi:hypothetical protein